MSFEINSNDIVICNQHNATFYYHRRLPKRNTKYMKYLTILGLFWFQLLIRYFQSSFQVQRSWDCQLRTQTMWWLAPVLYWVFLPQRKKKHLITTVFPGGAMYRHRVVMDRLRQPKCPAARPLQEHYVLYL